MRIFFLLFFIFFISKIGFGQMPSNMPTSRPMPAAAPTDSGKVEIIRAAVGEFIVYKNALARKLKGNVLLSHKDALMFCDSAIIDAADDIVARGNVVIQQGDSLTIFADSVVYKSGIRVADLYGDVVLNNKGKKLFTRRLTYDLNTKIATYNNRATLTDDRRQLTSKRGQYYVKTNEAFFKEQVTIVDSAFSLKTDTLQFNTQSNVATFLAPTRIRMKDSADVYTEGGYYDLEKDRAEFTKTPQYKKNTQIALADTIAFDGKKDLISLYGNARTEDGTRKATANTIKYNRKTEESWLEGNAVFIDSTQNVVSDTIKYNSKSKTYATRGRSEVKNGAQTIKADFIDFDATDSLGIAKGNVFWQDTSAKTTLYAAEMRYDQRRDYIRAFGERPVMMTQLDNDTLWLRADTIISFKPVPTDSARALLAYRKVRMFKSDFQAVCDSLTYFDRDSMFRLFYNPIVWSDTSQLTGDTMRITLKDKKIDRVYLRQNAFIINSPDQIFFNQIKGRDITAYFEGDDIRRMLAEGNAESVYYVQDETKAYVSVNKILCAEMLVLFGDNKVNKIKFYSQPQATMFPVKTFDHVGQRLKGYRWEEKIRPKNKEDL